MSADQPGGWMAPGCFSNASGWTVGPAGPGFQQTAGSSAAAPDRWPLPPPRRPWRIARWLASPASGPLWAGVTAVTAVGWASGALLIVAAATAGRAIGLAGAVGAAGLVLPTAASCSP